MLVCYTHNCEENFMTTKKDIVLLVVMTFSYLLFTLIGSYITTGNIIDLLIILTLVCYLIQFACLKIKERKK